MKPFLFLVVDFAGDLGNRIHQAKSSQTSFPESQVMGWFVQITFALVYIHDLKILHRGRHHNQGEK